MTRVVGGNGGISSNSGNRTRRTISLPSSTSTPTAAGGGRGVRGEHETTGDADHVNVSLTFRLTPVVIPISRL